MKKKRLTIAELQRIPKDRFPLKCKTDRPAFAYTVYEKIQMFGAADGAGQVPIMNLTGEYSLMSADNLKEYPSFEPNELMQDHDVYVCQYCAENSTIRDCGSVVWCKPPTHLLRLHDLVPGEFYTGSNGKVYHVGPSSLLCGFRIVRNLEELSQKFRRNT